MNKTLDDWLNALNSEQQMDLGLARVKQVHQNLNLKPITTITVAGTNGKGSTVAILTSLLQSLGLSTGAFTSPHIFTFNERVAINGRMVDDDVLIAAFERVEAARGEVVLTYFEWVFLVACCVFETAQVDVQIMEVGLGGRLDAVNVIDADAAIITGIALDHCDWLGDDIESIAKEKAGVLRQDQVAVFATVVCPDGIKEVATDVGCDIQLAGDDYHVKLLEDGFDFKNKDRYWTSLSAPQLHGDWQIQNAAAAIHCLSQLGHALTADVINQGMNDVSLMGRLQTISESPHVLADVAHNAQSAEKLAEWLQANPVKGHTRAVFSVLADKQPEQWLDCFQGIIDHWLVFELDGDRAMPIDELKCLLADHAGMFSVCNSGQHALAMAQAASDSDDRVVIFGSFHVLESALDSLSS